MNTNVFLHHAEEVKRKRHGERRRSISESQKRAMMLGSRVHHHQSYGGGQALIKQPATSVLRTSPTTASKSEYEDFDRESSLTSGSSNEVVVVTTDNNSKFDQLHSVRYKLEHNQLSRTTSETDKVRAFRILDEHLTSPDWEVKQFAVQLVHDILPHVGSDALDHCMAEVLPNLIPCLGSAGISIRKAAIQAVHIYLRFTSDISSVLKAIVSYGLDQPDQTIVHEILISIPLLFPEDFDDSYRGVRNLFHLVSGLARKLVPEDTRLPAFMSLQRLADVVGVKQFQAYLSKLTGDQKKIYDELSTIRPSQSIKLNNNDFDDSMNGGGGLVMIHGRKVSTQFAPTGGWFEYGAIDDSIIEKLRDEEDVRVRLSGADELNRAVKSMKDLTPLLPQMRLFLTFMDSVLEGEHNFKMVLLVLETYGVLIDRMRHKVKPHLRSLCTALLRHASNTKIVVRIENYRVIKKLMLVAKPNIVLTHFFDHLGDKRSMVREDVLNIVMYALLTFPSNEFDLKNIAATVVPTLVDPKRRVRQASQECVAILAAFMGPTKAAPLIRSIELLESHFERGTGVLNAVQARLSRRQLPRITQDGLVEYSLQVPCLSASIGLQRSRGTSRRGRSESPVHAKKYGADIEWILAGTGSVSSGSAKSVSTCRSESRLDESFSSSNSFPNSPITARRTASPSTIENTVVSTDPLQRKTPVAIHGTGFLKAAKSEDTISSSKTSRRSSILEENSTNSSDNNENNKRLPNLEEASSGHAGKAAGVSGNKPGSSSQGAKGKNVNEAAAASSSTSSSELPRLIGTKSQASTASSSATRDSGISVNDVQKAAEEALKNKRTSSNVSSSHPVAASRRASKVSLNRGSRTSSSRSNVSNNRASANGMISVDDLPIAGRAMPLGRRPGTNKSLTSNFDSGLDSRSTLGTAASSRQNEHIAYSRSISSGSASVKPNGFLKNSASLHQQLASHGTTLTKKAVSETVIHQRSRDEVTPPRSPLLVVESNKAAHLLLRPADNSPFTSTPATIHGLHHVSNQSNASTNSTPFSQISVPSSYEYEDDFTSESESEVSLLPAAMLPMPGLPTIPHHSYQLPNSTTTGDKRSAHSQRTVKSTNSSGSSRIPIKRNSSLRRQSSNKTNHQSRELMHSYKNSGTDDGEEEPQTLVIEDPTFSVPPASPTKPLSQAEFDDMPLPVSRSASSKAGSSQDQGLPRTAGGKASRKQQPSKNIESRPPPNVSVQKRPFLQRRTSPNKIINKNTTPSSATTGAAAKAAAATANATVTKARVGNFARSPPSKRVHKSVESTRTSIGKVTSSKTPSTLRSNKSSIIHKSTPNLSSTPSASTASSFNKASATVEVTRSSSHGRTTSSHNFEDIQEQQQSIANDNNGYSLGLLEADAVAEAAEDNLIEAAAAAVPFVNPVNKIARTPPTMTRKVISVVGNPEPDDYMVEPFTNGSTNGFIPKSSVKENLPPLDNEFGLEHHHPREEPLLNKAAAASSQQPQPPNSSTYSRAAVAPGTAASTASSVSVSNLHFLALKTQVTLKSPLEGHNLGPFHKPEEFLQRTLDNLSSDDWEANVNGMAGVLRFARHHPEYLLVEYKPLLQLVMKHVKNLRSQVCRTAVMVVGESFTQLKRNLEPELEKVMMPLILKSGDTNKFLREDCNVTLDAIVENSSPAKIILIVTAEAVFHKSPVVRTTVSRLLAYTVERMGVHKALSGGKDITEKLLPAVAKLAQDGSPDARNYSKSCLHRMLHEHPDCEKILKKSLTSNTMRNLEKIIEALKNGKANHTNGFSSRGSRGSRRGNSRKTL